MKSTKKYLTPIECFYAYSVIPHGSRNEKAAADYVEKFGIECGCEVYRDSYNNVIITKKATPGYESGPAIMLQAHLDMVCVSEPGLEFDFDKEPIVLEEKDGILRAKGTTLGADDAVGVALMLSLLTDEKAEHPTVECVFTSAEEVGLIGACALDKSRLKSRYMINLDSGPAGTFIVSSAGGCTAEIKKPIRWVAADSPVWKISITGLTSGHSGSGIHLRRANALVICGMFLRALCAAGGRIGNIKGGDRDNAIPAYCTAEFAFPGDPGIVLEPLASEIKKQWSKTDPGMEIVWEQTNVSRVLSSDDSLTVEKLLLTLPDGPILFSREIPELVETSSNLAVIKTRDELEMHLTLRSSSDFWRAYYMEKVKATAECCGASCAFHTIFSGWEFEPVSRLREIASHACEKIYGSPAMIQGIHAGLECGVFKGAIPDLDIIATGPVYGAVHSTSEWLDIASMGKAYDFILEILRGFAERTDC